MEDPKTREEWQEAVDEASFYLHLDASIKYGMVTYEGAKINRARCEELLERGRAVGVVPAPDAVERVLRTKLKPPPPDITGGAAA